MDSTGKKIRFACVNWYGAHMERFVVNGADQQSIDSIARLIASLGFNCVRLPFSIEMYAKKRSPPASGVTHNSWLYGKSAAEVYDATVEAITNAGLMVILNNHISDAKWCCDGNDGNGLWWTPQYPTAKFEEVLVDVTQRYLNNSMVVGFDLRNELRNTKIAGVPMVPLWNLGKSFGKQLDWHDEAEVVGNKILEVNPEMLIIVEGLQYANMIPRMAAKVNLNVPNKLIYSGHVYAWDGGLKPGGSFSDFDKAMKNMLKWISDRDDVPFWLGEFGTNTRNTYWYNVINWLKKYPDIGWAYWALDGYKYPGTSEAYGILNYNYASVKQWGVVNDLKQVMGIKPAPGACCLYQDECIPDDWCNASKDRCLGPCNDKHDKKWGPPKNAFVEENANNTRFTE